MKTYYLAVDIGASGGRHILGHLEEERLILEEMYRFPNKMEEKEGNLCWDLLRLFEEIKTGLKRCKVEGKIPCSMGIDTWAVDYVLLDKQKRILGNTWGYRDGRTKGMDQKVYEILSESELYSRTGIQKQIFNTIYQLMAVKEHHPEQLEQARTFLMIPDYFHFLLTGNMCSEYTNATSTQLVNAKTNDWDRDLMECLGIPREIFLPLSQPGTAIGTFTEELADEVGFPCQVVLPATHDTASAVMAVPGGEENCLYISSGTWSLMGTENRQAICSEESRRRNFTNEGGYDYRYRYLKNIMGLWMIQSVRRELGNVYSFEQLCQMAEQSRFISRVDVNEDVFFAPKSMCMAIQEACLKSGQPVPETSGEFASVIYESLADSYRRTAEEIEELTGKRYDSIYIVGGGSSAEYLNRLTSIQSGRRVLAGPKEATAIGNLMAQMIAKGEFSGLSEARECVRKSFEISEYNS